MFNSVHIVCFGIVLIAPMLILGAIVISDIGLVNILSDQGNGSRRREYGVCTYSRYCRFSDTGAGLA